MVQTIAKGLGSVTEMIIQGIFPWCFTPELYAAKPDYIESLAAFVRGRPAQPLDAFLQQSNAVIGHDAGSQLGKMRRLCCLGREIAWYSMRHHN
jgi:hypothetical protein